ncbi:MAG: protein TolQ [Gammaproteobacteria bacterium]|nr:protein TolQ [Gammaproteobacteria bacterium]MCY4219355.1 protein TolQ [Gammaproteobacteria bacterium]MCY4276095.1 protein TolQ [Gammaproteobacteria bacterium]
MDIQLPSHLDYSILDLILAASIPVQLVMLILLTVSVMSWYMIDRKFASFRRWNKVADLFEDQFWSGGEVSRIYQQWNDMPNEPEGIVNIFLAGYSEFGRLAKNPDIERTQLLDGVNRAMRVALSREVVKVEHHLPFLATVGSTSPYVGLFGTVWGIMHSFQAISGMQQITIATVAPGIAEALIATAMGLFAAIPAVMAYNKFANTAERLNGRYEVFMEEFLSIIARQVRSSS